MKTICISAGHSAKCPGAADILDEFTENCRVVQAVAAKLKAGSFIDTASRDQNTNLNAIVDWHNSKARDLDVSIHFNCSDQHTTKPIGVEVLYVTQDRLAAELSAAIAGASGLIDRGAKYRDNLFFLNNTHEPAVLIEVCFVDSEADAEIYQRNFGSVCDAIVAVLAGDDDDDGVLFEATGKCSTFGGPDDDGVAADEPLAFIQEVEQAPHLFLPYQPPNTTGLARRLNPHVHYLACRWNYDVTPRAMLLEEVALVRAPMTGIALTAFPADWGPNANTGRVADLSPGLMQDLGIGTDDEVEVVFPFKD